MSGTGNLPDHKKLHQMIMMKIWEDIAADIYQSYLRHGRGVLAMFMLDTLPDFLKDQLPEGEGVMRGSIMSIYIPLARVHTLEELVGLEGVLKIDEQVHRYDPAKSIVFAFFNKKVAMDGTRGVSCRGYEMTPPARLSPLAMYRKKGPVVRQSGAPTKSGEHPLINLN